jgi:hypothetical protein
MDRNGGGNRYYSDFLNICILAIGYRYANRTRRGIQTLVNRNNESILHNEAKKFVEFELQTPSGI